MSSLPEPSEGSEKKQRPAHLWKPGQSGNPSGRPLGVRNKLGELFIAALYDDFQKSGVEVIERVRLERPQDYLKVCASLLPKQLNVNVSEWDEMSEEELDRRCNALIRTIEAKDRVSAVIDGEAQEVRAEQACELPAVQETG